MSLVERALKKLQASQAGAAAHAKPAVAPVPAVAARVSDTVRVPVLSGQDVQPQPQPQPRRAIERPSRIVHIDREALRAIKLLPPVALERGIASQYQQVKRPLITAATGRGGAQLPNGHLVMLTSALPGEGKTFTSINLALSMALEEDVEVLLVDADVAKPHVSHLFGLEGERGLLDLLTDSELHPDTVILRTDVDGLSLMPAGRRIETATELLASERMLQVAAQLGTAGGRRIVLFDSPPLLLSTESLALLGSVGHVVMIVRADETSRMAVNDALEIIGGRRPVSLILNQSSSGPSNGYYGYGSYGESQSEQRS
jgi:protein-tyrosine kinase